MGECCMSDRRSSGKPKLVGDCELNRVCYLQGQGARQCHARTKVRVLMQGFGF